MPLPTLGVLDKDEVARTINTLASARQAAADSAAVALSTEDKAVIDALATALGNILLSAAVWGTTTDTAQSDGDTVTATTIAALLRGALLQESKGRYWTDSLGAVIDVASEYVGQVGGTTPRITATMLRAGDPTQYSLGDGISNSTTVASVVPIQFNVTRSGALLAKRSGRLSGCRCTITAASGTIVLPAFYLYLFRPETGIPFAAGSYPADNAAFNVSAAAMKELVGVFEFRVDDWLNQAGGSTAAGTQIYQAAPLKPLSGSLRSRAYAPFNLALLTSDNILALMQAQNTWNPGAVANTFDFALDADID